MALSIYLRLPANGGTQVGQTSTFIGDNVSDVFTYGTSTTPGSTIQYSSTQKLRFNGGWILGPGGNEITIDAVPPLGAQGVIPDATCLIMSAYDQDTVQGVSEPRVDEIIFYVGDVSEISTYSYTAPTDRPGLGLAFVNLITAISPDVSWVQLACCDSDINPLTYGATGETLWLNGLYAFSLVADDAPINTTTLEVDDASTFTEGRYIILNSGNLTSEIIQVSSIEGTTMTMASSFNYPHYIGETVYECLIPISEKMTVPTNATGGQATNCYNLALNVIAKKEQRD